MSGIAAAYNADYTHTEYMTGTAPTIDGQYTSADEWLASGSETFGPHLWRDMWQYGDSIFANVLVQASDATNDAGDTFTLCFDGNADGGAAPQADDYKVVVTGHGGTATVQWYQGTGTGWNAIGAPADVALAQAQTSLAILEISIDKNGAGVPLSMYWAFMVSYNDASGGSASWPPAPASTDVPDGWGYIIYDSGANPNPDVPEGIGFVAMATVSCIALVAGTYYIRKKTKP